MHEASKSTPSFAMPTTVPMLKTVVRLGPQYISSERKDQQLEQYAASEATRRRPAISNIVVRSWPAWYTKDADYTHMA